MFKVLDLKIFEDEAVPITICKRTPTLFTDHVAIHFYGLPHIVLFLFAFFSLSSVFFRIFIKEIVFR